MINLIAACDRNMLMGNQGKLPWNIRKDWDYFQKKTKGGILIMGRTCYEDFQQHQQPHEVIVLSKAYSGNFKGAQRSYSLEGALQIAKARKKPIWICGGRKVYEEAMPQADYLYLTQIDSVFKGDVYFPPWKTTFTREISRVTEQENGITLHFTVYAKE